MAIGVLPAVLLAWALYAFNLFAFGPVLILFALNLMAMGWWVSLGVVSLILRHGAGPRHWPVGAVRADAVLGRLLPGRVLPEAVRPLALALPASHVFEDSACPLEHGTIAWGHMAWATGLNALWLGAAGLLFMVQFRVARERGALLTIGE